MNTKTIKKEDLVNCLLDAKKLQHISKFKAKFLVENIFSQIISILEDGEEFKVQHFGKFSLIDKKERPGRNPKTGEPVPIDARRVVVFTPSKQLKDGVKKRLNNKNYDYANDAEMQNFYAKNY